MEVDVAPAGDRNGLAFVVLLFVEEGLMEEEGVEVDDDLMVLMRYTN